MAENESTTENGPTTEEMQRDASDISFKQLVAGAGQVVDLLYTTTRGPSEAIPVLIAALANVDVAGRDIDMKDVSPAELFARLPREEMIADMQNEVRRIYEFLIPTPEELAREKNEPTAGEKKAS